MSTRATGTAVIVCLIIASAAAFARAEQLKLIRAPIATPVVTRYFSPVCPPGPRCRAHSARVRFFLRTPSRVSITITDASGSPVRALTPSAGTPQSKGWVDVRWNGDTDTGAQAADGRYRVRVTLLPQNRTFILPEPLNLDSTAPTVTLTTPAGSTIIHYLVSGQAAVYAVYRPVTPGGPAHAMTFRGRNGILQPHPKKLVKGVTYRVTVYATEPAGNQSSMHPAGTYTP